MEKDFLPEDLVPKSFMNQFGSLIKCALGGWDRLRFHASLRPLFSPQGMRPYLIAAKVRLTDFADHAQALTHRLVQEAQNLAARSGRPYQFLRSSRTSEEDLIEDIAQRDHIHRGLIAVLADPAAAQALASTQAGIPRSQLAGPLCRPITHDGCRYRALHPLGMEAPLLQALSRGEWTISGFRNRDLQRLLFIGEPRNKKTARRRSAAIGRKLRLLRAHGLIRKLPHTHRYVVADSGRTTLTALLAAQQADTQKLTLAWAA